MTMISTTYERLGITHQGVASSPPDLQDAYNASLLLPDITHTHKSDSVSIISRPSTPRRRRLRTNCCKTPADPHLRTSYHTIDPTTTLPFF